MTQMTQNRKHYTTRQLSELFGFKPKLLCHWRDRRLTRYIKLGRAVFYYLDEFEEDLAKMTQRPEMMKV